jgi:hypothetical protein
MESRGKEDMNFVKMMVKRLQESQQYLETDFKVHVKPNSRVADHCVTFALSDATKRNLRKKCDAEGEGKHVHDLICDRCTILHRTLAEVQDHAKYWDLPATEKSITQSKIEKAASDIAKMKQHQVRTVQKGFERNEIIDNLAQDEAFITFDFAMKLEPKKGRERESDFFGKRG